MSSAQKQNLITWVPIFITIVAYIIVFAFLWGTFTTKTDANASAINSLQNQHDTFTSEINTLNINMFLVCDKLEVKCIKPK